MTHDMGEILREAIRKSGLSANQLAKETGVKQTTISKFLRGGDMGLARASKIAAYLGLELRKRR